MKILNRVYVSIRHRAPLRGTGCAGSGLYSWLLCLLQAQSGHGWERVRGACRELACIRALEEASQDHLRDEYLAAKRRCLGKTMVDSGC